MPILHMARHAAVEGCEGFCAAATNSPKPMFNVGTWAIAKVINVHVLHDNGQGALSHQSLAKEVVAVMRHGYWNDQTAAPSFCQLKVIRHG